MFQNFSSVSAFFNFFIRILTHKVSKDVLALKAKPIGLCNSSGLPFPIVKSISAFNSENRPHPQ